MTTGLSAIAVCEMLDRAAGKSMAELKDALPKTWSSPTMSPLCADENKYAVVDAMVKDFEALQGKGETVRASVRARHRQWRARHGGGRQLGPGAGVSNKPELVVVVESPVSDSACGRYSRR